MCAKMQDENKKLIREASQHKSEEIRKWESTKILAASLQVLRLGEEADKLSRVRDYHAAEQCYLKALKNLPQHAQSLCNYAYLLHYGKREFDTAEEIFQKALQTEPHRVATLFNYAGHLQ